ncbi:amidohydrolase family protein [Sciscionella marina]|uniref:amidohydrolase family protein n=1 Tax=Sciscionella marina TaxID=508770 RepID=UPI0003710C25|nr:amidohydrolase family protein [Sciscionella marina]
MKLICIEEHTMDPATGQAAAPSLEREAPYMSLQSSPKAASGPPDPTRPNLVEMSEAIRLGTDLGAGRIANMDQHRIDMQIVSYSTPIQLAPPEQARTLARAANERLAEAVAANPERLQGFAMLPWQLPAAAAQELEHAVTGLGLRGVLLVGRPGDTFLDDPAYRPVLEKITELGVPLYLHPFHPVPQVQQAYYAGLPEEVSTQFSLGGWGWHHEAGVHLLRLILSGVFERLPGLQVISGHWGELVPFYLHRLDHVIPTSISGLGKPVSEIYRSNVWITPSGMFHRAHFEFIRETLGLDRLIWSVDYPYLTLDGTRSFLGGLSLGSEEKHKITHGNAEKLFRL